MLRSEGCVVRARPRWLMTGLEMPHVEREYKRETLLITRLPLFPVVSFLSLPSRLFSNILHLVR